MSYATVAELRAEMNLESTSDDATLQRLLNAADKKIDRHCNRPDGFEADASASARYYVGSGKSYQRIDECVEVTAIAVKDSPGDDEDSYTAWVVGTIGTTTEADVFPATGDPERPYYNDTPYTLLVIGANANYDHFVSGGYTGRAGFSRSEVVKRGVTTVEVTARWGYSASVPDDIKEAAIMQSARWYKRLQSAMADVAGSLDVSELRLYTRKLDPDIAGILVDGRYIKPMIARR